MCIIIIIMSLFVERHRYAYSHAAGSTMTGWRTIARAAYGLQTVYVYI